MTRLEQHVRDMHATAGKPRNRYERRRALAVLRRARNFAARCSPGTRELFAAVVRIGR